MNELEVLKAGFEIPWSWIFGIAVACGIAAKLVYKSATRIIGENAFELTFKEFDLLKNLEEAGYAWIARDFNGKLHTYNARPRRISKLFIFHVWKAPQNSKIEVRTARIRKSYFSQLSRFRKEPCQISDILYLDGKNRRYTD